MKRISILLIALMVFTAGLLSGCNETNKTNNHQENEQQEEEDKENQKPNASAWADPTNGTAPLTVYFSSFDCYDPDGLIVTFKWDFDDGSPIVQELNPSHIFKNPGNYTVTLAIIDDDNAVDYSYVNITVY